MRGPGLLCHPTDQDFLGMLNCPVNLTAVQNSKICDNKSPPLATCFSAQKNNPLTLHMLSLSLAFQIWFGKCETKTSHWDGILFFRESLDFLFFESKTLFSFVWNFHPRQKITPTNIIPVTKIWHTKLALPSARELWCSGPEHLTLLPKQISEENNRNHSLWSGH